jgi:hypothetical protein
MRREKIALGALVLVLAVWIAAMLLTGIDYCFKRWLGIKMGFIEDEMSIGCNDPSFEIFFGIIISIVGIAAVFGAWFIWKGLKEERK